MVAPVYRIPDEKKVYTREDLRRIEGLPENTDKVFELLNGDLYEMTPPSHKHAAISSRILNAIRRYLDVHDIGVAYGDNTGYDLPTGDTLIPDASFIAYDRLPPEDEPLKIAPNLAIEVMSPSHTDAQINVKVDTYLMSGTRLVWVIYPERRIVSVYYRQLDGTTIYRSLNDKDTLSGDDVLSSFSVAIGVIFTAPSKA